jgi:nucleotide-binding universal stress UspA family protein
VTVTHAYDDMNSSNGERLPDEESPGVTNAVKHLTRSGVSVEPQELYDPFTESIAYLAAELNADKIVISGRKRSPTGKALFGSVTQSVILNTNIPVTVVPNE